MDKSGCPSTKGVNIVRLTLTDVTGIIMAIGKYTLKNFL